MEEMALEEPAAKKEACWKRRVVVVISTGVREWACRTESWRVERRRMGILVARDWVARKKIRRECRVWMEPEEWVLD